LIVKTLVKQRSREEQGVANRILWKIGTVRKVAARSTVLLEIESHPDSMPFRPLEQPFVS
jgi:hypothetical protein